MKYILFILFLFIAFQVENNAQSIIEPIHRPVYDFLEQMSNKGIINILPVMKPFTRNDVNNFLKEIEKESRKLSKIEAEELSWYKEEYNVENIYTKNFQDGVFENENMFRFYFYRDSLFSFYFSPLVNYKIDFSKGNTTKKFEWGFSSYGTINDLGFRIDFNDNSLSADKILANDYFSNEQGRVVSLSSTKDIQFDNTNGSFIYQNSFLTVGAIKENINFGSSYRSQLILSDKAPSFPSIYLKLHPVSWFQFYFLHGWLNSSVTDSSRTYSTEINRERIVEADKYYVLHAIQLDPISNLSFTLGETIIYSDRNVYFGYFIPFLFYRSVDHGFSMDGKESGNNGSFFTDISYRPVDDLKLYTSLFVDELALSQLLKGETDRNQFGYTVGLRSSGLIEDASFTVEYTKILPWVYSNWIPSQTYTNSTFLLGHYIGQNADQIYIQADYRLKRGLEVRAWGEFIRKGGISDVINQYELPGETFLYGLRRNEFNWGIESSYEVFHDLSINAFYRYSNISDDDKLRTPSWQLGVRHSFGISAYFGL